MTRGRNHPLRHLILSCALLCFYPTLLFSENKSGETAPHNVPVSRRLLNEKILTRLVDEFPRIESEFRAAGLSLSGLSNPSTLSSWVAGMKADRKAKIVLRRNGWSPSIYGQLAAILYAYTALKVEDAEESSLENLREARILVSENAALSDAERSRLLAKVEDARSQVRALRLFYSDAVHSDDLALVRKNRETIALAFEAAASAAPMIGVE